ncbi:RNA 2',3'-cyclic phosphodiesterase [Polycladomyces subterraneus]|uniref:RNA 2',3'-cyclic phosphodiesterase n=1 Tax=Polycladomyces subterraneus TaxID=1016997 RepID=A0ABT8IMH2_9BACL|nr:RNA 2',3'-cyclic phosphodiesterase [Polycladomyces subterraneus]MDN4593990.1 RNA 2',3'-cyclic phosphodiesterase [Polycladomyces subterraneus]
MSRENGGAIFNKHVHRKEVVLISDWRLFVAVRLDRPCRQLLTQWCEQIRSTGWDTFGKWVHPEDYHVTLFFLGACKPEQVPYLQQQLTRVAGKQTPFTLKLNGIGVFGIPRRPRILWAGVDGDVPTLNALQEKVVQALTPLGFHREDRPFRPHITLARQYKRNDFDAEQVNEIVVSTAERGAEWMVKDLVLYRTMWGRVPMYEPMAVLPFRWDDQGGER